MVTVDTVHPRPLPPPGPTRRRRQESTAAMVGVTPGAPETPNCPIKRLRLDSRSNSLEPVTRHSTSEQRQPPPHLPTPPTTRKSCPPQQGSTTSARKDRASHKQRDAATAGSDIRLPSEGPALVPAPCRNNRSSSKQKQRNTASGNKELAGPERDRLDRVEATRVCVRGRSGLRPVPTWVVPLPKQQPPTSSALNAETASCSFPASNITTDNKTGTASESAPQVMDNRTPTQPPLPRQEVNRSRPMETPPAASSSSPKRSTRLVFSGRIDAEKVLVRGSGTLHEKLRDIHCLKFEAGSLFPNNESVATLFALLRGEPAASKKTAARTPVGSSKQLSVRENQQQPLRLTDLGTYNAGTLTRKQFNDFFTGLASLDLSLLEIAEFGSLLYTMNVAFIVFFFVQYAPMLDRLHCTDNCLDGGSTVLQRACASALLSGISWMGFRNSSVQSGHDSLRALVLNTAHKTRIRQIDGLLLRDVLPRSQMCFPGRDGQTPVLPESDWNNTAMLVGARWMMIPRRKRQRRIPVEEEDHYQSATHDWVPRLLAKRPATYVAALEAAVARRGIVSAGDMSQEEKHTILRQTYSGREVLLTWDPWRTDIFWLYEVIDLLLDRRRNLRNYRPLVRVWTRTVTKGEAAHHTFYYAELLARYGALVSVRYLSDSDVETLSTANCSLTDAVVHGTQCGARRATTDTTTAPSPVPLRTQEAPQEPQSLCPADTPDGPSDSMAPHTEVGTRNVTQDGVSKPNQRQTTEDAPAAFEPFASCCVPDNGSPVSRLVPARSIEPCVCMHRDTGPSTNPLVPGTWIEFPIRGCLQATSSIKCVGLGIVLGHRTTDSRRRHGQDNNVTYEVVCPFNTVEDSSRRWAVVDVSHQSIQEHWTLYPAPSWELSNLLRADLEHRARFQDASPPLYLASIEEFYKYEWADDDQRPLLTSWSTYVLPPGYGIDAKDWTDFGAQRLRPPTVPPDVLTQLASLAGRAKPDSSPSDPVIQSDTSRGDHVLPPSVAASLRDALTNVQNAVALYHPREVLSAFCNRGLVSADPVSILRTIFLSRALDIPVPTAVTSSRSTSPPISPTTHGAEASRVGPAAAPASDEKPWMKEEQEEEEYSSASAPQPSDQPSVVSRKRRATAPQGPARHDDGETPHKHRRTVAMQPQPPTQAFPSVHVPSVGQDDGYMSHVTLFGVPVPPTKLMDIFRPVVSLATPRRGEKEHHQPRPRQTLLRRYIYGPEGGVQSETDDDDDDAMICEKQVQPIPKPMVWTRPDDEVSIQGSPRPPPVQQGARTMSRAELRRWWDASLAEVTRQNTQNGTVPTRDVRRSHFSSILRDMYAAVDAMLSDLGVVMSHTSQCQCWLKEHLTVSERDCLASKLQTILLLGHFAGFSVSRDGKRVTRRERDHPSATTPEPILKDPASVQSIERFLLACHRLVEGSLSEDDAARGGTSTVRLRRLFPEPPWKDVVRRAAEAQSNFSPAYDDLVFEAKRATLPKESTHLRFMDRTRRHGPTSDTVIATLALTGCVPPTANTVSSPDAAPPPLPASLRRLTQSTSELRRTARILDVPPEFLERQLNVGVQRNARRLGQRVVALQHSSSSSDPDVRLYCQRYILQQAQEEETWLQAVAASWKRHYHTTSPEGPRPPNGDKKVASPAPEKRSSASTRSSSRGYHDTSRIPACDDLSSSDDASNVTRSTTCPSMNPPDQRKPPPRDRTGPSPPSSSSRSRRGAARNTQDPRLPPASSIPLPLLPPSTGPSRAGGHDDRFPRSTDPQPTGSDGRRTSVDGQRRGGPILRPVIVKRHTVGATSPSIPAPPVVPAVVGSRQPGSAAPHLFRTPNVSSSNQQQPPPLQPLSPPQDVPAMLQNIAELLHAAATTAPPATSGGGTGRIPQRQQQPGSHTSTAFQPAGQRCLPGSFTAEELLNLIARARIETMLTQLLREER